METMIISQCDVCETLYEATSANANIPLQIEGKDASGKVIGHFNIHRIFHDDNSFGDFVPFYAQYRDPDSGKLLLINLQYFTCELTEPEGNDINAYKELLEESCTDSKSYIALYRGERLKTKQIAYLTFAQCKKAVIDLMMRGVFPSSTPEATRYVNRCLSDGSIQIVAMDYSV